MPRHSAQALLSPPPAMHPTMCLYPPPPAPWPLVAWPLAHPLTLPDVSKNVPRPLLSAICQRLSPMRHPSTTLT